MCIRWRQFNQRIVIHSRNEESHGGANSSGKFNYIEMINLPVFSFSGSKNSNRYNRDDCIITVLDANDLPPLNSNTSSTVTAANTSNQSTSPSTMSINRNRRHRRFFHRLFRSNQTNT